MLWIVSFKKIEEKKSNKQNKECDDALQFENWNFVSNAILHVWFSLVWLGSSIFRWWFTTLTLILCSSNISYFIYCIYVCLRCAVCSLHALHFHYLSIYFIVWQFCEDADEKCNNNISKMLQIIIVNSKQPTANILIDDMIKVIMQPSLYNFILWIDDAIWELNFLWKRKLQK